MPHLRNRNSCAIPNPSSTAPNHNFNLSQMVYHKTNDTYTRPSNQTLKSNRRWYNKGVYQKKQYKTPHCKNCELRAKCTTSKSARIVERHEFSHALDRNRTAIKNNHNIYSQRRSLVEHPFGTMKRAWGFDHIMTKKTMKHASADVGFIFIAYNLKRILNAVDLREQKEKRYC